jgi:hypothetical protein
VRSGHAGVSAPAIEVTRSVRTNSSHVLDDADVIAMRKGAL